jgi:hypothetical protein
VVLSSSSVFSVSSRQACLEIDRLKSKDNYDLVKEFILTDIFLKKSVR